VNRQEKDAMTPMPRRLLITLTGCLVILRVASGSESGQQNQLAPVTPETRATTVPGFAPVGDVQMYYEIRVPESRFCSSMAAVGLLLARGHPTT
jgi:hypothetical protein